MVSRMAFIPPSPRIVSVGLVSWFYAVVLVYTCRHLGSSQNSIRDREREREKGSSQLVEISRHPNTRVINIRHTLKDMQEWLKLEAKQTTIKFGDLYSREV
jgi:hypothetical protein